MKDTHIDDEILSRSASERARIALKLIDSLEELTETEWQDLWLAEAERRDSELDDGTDPGIPSDSLFSEMRNQFG